MHSSNIQIEEGIEALREELNTTIDKSVPTELYIKLLKMVLEINIHREIHLTPSPCISLFMVMGMYRVTHKKVHLLKT